MQSPAQVDLARRLNDGNDPLQALTDAYAPGDLIGDGYVVVARLAGVVDDAVFSCCEERSGEQVAIRALLRPTPERVQRLKSEFRELQESGAPQLPRARSLHVSEREAFIVMDLCDEVDYAQVLRSPKRHSVALSGADGDPGGPEEKLLPLVGREAELERLRRISVRACNDGGRVLVLWGASGMGKTRLLAELGAEWRERGDWVLQGRCYPSEFVPFASLDGVMDSLRQRLLRLSPAERSLLARDELQVLAQAFPVLDGLVGQGSSRRRRDLGRNVGQLGVALRAMFTQLVWDRPIAVFVDDAHWGDEDGWRVLSRLWQEPLPRGLLLVLALRDEGNIAAQLRQDLAGAAVEELTLAPLADDSCVELARRAGMPVDGEAPPSLLGLGGGNPNWVIHLARAARTVESPRSLQEAVALRLAEAPAGGIFVLKLLAVAGGPLPEAIVRRALEGDADFHRDVGRLRAQGLVVARRTSRGDAALDFDHDSTRAGVLELLQEEERSSLLARLARAVESERRASSSPIAEYHLGAGNPARAVDSALVAAAKAREQLAFARAARLYEIALRHGCADPGERCNVLRHLGEVMVAAGQGLQGAERIIEGAELAPDPGEAIKLRALGVESLFRCAEHARALEHLHPLLNALGLTLWRRQSIALATLLSLRGQLWLQRRRGAERGRELSPEARLRMDVLWSLGVGLSLYDPLNAFILQVRHALLAEQQGSPEHIALARATESFILAWEGGERNRRQSRRAMAAAEERALTTTDPRVRAHLYVMSAGIASAEERSQDVLEVSALGLAYCEEFCPQAHWEAAQLASLRAIALLHAGKLPEMADWVRTALGATDQGEDRLERLLLRGGLCAVAWIAAGRAERLQEELDSAEDAPLRGYYRFQHLWARAALALAARAPEQAWKLAERAYATCRADFLFRLRTVRIEMHDLRARCALTLAARSGGSAALERAVAGSIRRLEREEGDWPAGLAAANAGLLAFRRGQREYAREKLAEAKICFERGGMRLHAHAARARLAELTGRPLESPDSWRLWLEEGGAARLAAIIDVVLAPLGARA